MPKNTIILLLLISLQNCFASLSPEFAQIFSSPDRKSSSYFGYSVQLQASRDNTNGRLIVGAPRANSSYPNHRGLIEPGAAYSCSLNNDNKCAQILLDPNGNSNGTYNGTNYVDKKHYAGLGFSIDALKYVDQLLVICAPRWINDLHFDIYQVNGMCYIIDDHLNKIYKTSARLIPLIDTGKISLKGKHNWALGEAGFSTHFIQSTSSLIISAPGMYNSIGSLIQYNLKNSNENFYVVNPDRNDESLSSNSYFGYSTSSGKFSNKQDILYISGAPRNMDLLGTVNIFDSITNNDPFHNRYNFKGKQMGAYYGSAIASGDINGDGFDDVIIGAPMYSTEDQEDIGCIYTFITMKNTNYKQNLVFHSSNIILGETVGSRFGYAISSLGDINDDGCADIVVGAPYYENQGAIYIYLGGKDGILKFDKRITASDIDNTLRGFGISLSRGCDIDNNQYNDLAVGAYISGHVVVLKSRPLINFISSIRPNIKEINIETTKFNVEYCLKYTTKIILTEIPIKFNVITSQFIVLTAENNYIKKIRKNEQFCHTLKFNVQKSTNFLSPSVNITYMLILNNIEEKFKPHQQSGYIYTIIPFSNGCSSLQCKPNLKLSAAFYHNSSHLIIGSVDTIIVHVQIENIGENAYSTTFNTSILPSVSLQNGPDYCDEINSHIICNIRDVIATKTKKEFNLTLDLSKLSAEDQYFYSNMSVESSNDIDVSDNKFNLELFLQSDVNFTIIPKSYPQETENRTGRTEEFLHQFNLENNGKTYLKYLPVNIFIPYAFQGKEFISSNIQISGCLQNSTIHNAEINNIANNEMITNLLSENNLFLNCTNGKSKEVICYKIECVINNEDEKIISSQINITLKVDILQLDHLHSDGEIFIITSLQPMSKYYDQMYFNTWTTINYVPQFASVTWLAIGISVGILLVLILTFILYKLGYFKRKELPITEQALLMESKEQDSSSQRTVENELYHSGPSYE